MGLLHDALVAEFVARCTQRRFRSKDVTEARDCLRRIAIDSGFRANLDGLESRGAVVVAHATTDRTTNALATLTSYFVQRGAPHAEFCLRVLCYIPHQAALEHLLDVKRHARAHQIDEVERAVNTYHDLLTRRARQLTTVVLQHPDGGGARSVMGWRPDEYGWRLARITPEGIFEGWVREDEGTSLGIQQALELGGRFRFRGLSAVMGRRATPRSSRATAVCVTMSATSRFPLGGVIVVSAVTPLMVNTRRVAPVVVTDDATRLVPEVFVPESFTSITLASTPVNVQDVGSDPPASFVKVVARTPVAA